MTYPRATSGIKQIAPMNEGRRKYARDFSELTDADRISLADAMARIGREASERERNRNMRLVRSTTPKEG